MEGLSPPYENHSGKDNCAAIVCGSASGACGNTPRHGAGNGQRSTSI